MRPEVHVSACWAACYDKHTKQLPAAHRAAPINMMILLHYTQSLLSAISVFICVWRCCVVVAAGAAAAVVDKPRCSPLGVCVYSVKSTKSKTEKMCLKKIDHFFSEPQKASSLSLGENKKGA